MIIAGEFPEAVREFSDTEILTSTSDFEELVGKGGFGDVYKGIYHGTPIAVKRLHGVRMYIPVKIFVSG